MGRAVALLLVAVAGCGGGGSSSSGGPASCTFDGCADQVNAQALGAVLDVKKAIVLPAASSGACGTVCSQVSLN